MVEALGHVRAIEAHAELVARDARLRDDELGRAHKQPVTDAELGLPQATDGEVLAEHAPGEFGSWQLLAPELVVLGGIDVDRLLGSAVHREIGLAVAIQVQRAQRELPLYWLLKNRRPDGATEPLDLAREADIDRHDVHRRHPHYSRNRLTGKQ